MKKLILTLFLCFVFIGISCAESIYITNFGEDNVGTGADGVKTAIKLPAETVKVVKIYGGVEQGETTTSFDLYLYSDNVAGTEQEDILYPLSNVTTGYMTDDVPVYLTSSGTTDNTVYFKIHNDGNESDFDFWMLYKVYRTKDF